ncbi:MAG: hypothetical protein HYZ38_26640 [Mycobacterium sp.]|nr:hypothetical protein [Mycobacterium sp.]
MVCRTRLGGSTVAFISVTEDLDNRDRYDELAEVRTEVDVHGCRFRPLKVDQHTTEVGTFVSELWKATCPPEPAVLGAKPSGEIRVDGVVYQIVGAVRPYEDLRGGVIKVTVLAQKITS